MMDGHHISNRTQLVKEISQVQVASGIFVESQKVRRVALFYISANLYVLLNRKQLCSFICSYS